MNLWDIVVPIYIDERWQAEGKEGSAATLIADAIQTRLTLTVNCRNDRWHHSAPARAIDLCPECTPVESRVIAERDRIRRGPR